MRFSKFWLITIIVFIPTTYAAQNIKDALMNGTKTGDIRTLFTYGNDTDAGAVGRAHDNARTGSVALEINYKTDDLHGFRVAAGLQTSYDFGLQNASNYENDAKDDARNTITDTQLHRLYLGYELAKSRLRIGRFGVYTPLLFNSMGNFPMRDSFEGVDFISNALPDTVIQAVLIDKWNKPYGSDKSKFVNAGFVDAENDVTFQHSIYSIYLKNKSIHNMTFDGQYMESKDNSGSNYDNPVATEGAYTTYFVRTEYRLPFSHPISMGALYAGAHFRLKSNSDEDKTSVYGLKLSSKIGIFNVALAHTKVNDSRPFPGSMGYAPDMLLYTNTLLNKAIYAGVAATSLQLSSGFLVDGLSTRIKFLTLNQSSVGANNSLNRIVDGTKAFDFEIRYAFNQHLSIRSFSGFADYKDAVLSGEKQEDKALYTRFHINYKF